MSQVQFTKTILIIRKRLMYRAACKVEFRPFTVVLTADVFQLLIKLLITIIVLFVVVKTIEDNSLCHPRFHRANTTNHAWCMVQYCRYVRIAPSIIYVRQLRIAVRQGKKKPLCHPQFHTARTTNHGVWHCGYVWTYSGQFIRKPRVL